MPSSTTRTIDFQLLKARAPSAATVVKLMMACNDLSLANQALTEWKNEQSPSKQSRRIGACIYFVRLELAHLNEGLKVIKAIRDDPSLLALVRQCDQETQSSFRKLEDFLPSGVFRQEFETLIGRIRNNVTFHYDESGTLVDRAVSALAAKNRTSSVTRGSTAHVWYFKLADSIVNDIVCHQIWGISRTAANVDLEADLKADRVHQIFLWFVDFAGEFIWKYCKA
jgi:hypothetical protein